MDKPLHGLGAILEAHEAMLRRLRTFFRDPGAEPLGELLADLDDTLERPAPTPPAPDRRPTLDDRDRISEPDLIYGYVSPAPPPRRKRQKATT